MNLTNHGRLEPIVASPASLLVLAATAVAQREHGFARIRDVARYCGHESFNAVMGHWKTLIRLGLVEAIPFRGGTRYRVTPGLKWEEEV